MARRVVVVLGGSMAGVTAAVRARELDGEARIVVVPLPGEADELTAALPYTFAGETVAMDSLRRRPAESLWDVHRIEVRAGAEPRRIDPAARRVDLGGETLAYTALVYAADARPARPPVALAGQALVLRTAEDARRAAEQLGGGSRSVLVRGDGPAAVEAADALARGGHRVTLVLGAPRLLPDFSPAAAGLATQALAAAGIAVQARGPGARDDVEAGADVTLWAEAPVPDTDLVRKAGAELHEDGSVWVDELGATSLAHVFACGGSVSVPHAISGWPVWPLSAAAAEKTALVAGASAVGAHPRLAAVLGTMIVRAGELVLARTGLTTEETRAYAGPDMGRVTVHGSSCDRFLAASQPLSLDLVFHRASGRILGAEAWGRAGVDRRVDALATAMLGDVTVEQLALIDLAYAPPFGAARDIVNVAGRAAAAARAGLARPWTSEELSAARGHVVIVDVEPERGRVGDIQQSIVVPLPELRDRLATLPRGRPVVFVSLTGRSAYLAARIAHQAGLRDAGYLSGGMLSWTAAGLAVKQAGESR